MKPTEVKDIPLNLSGHMLSRRPVTEVKVLVYEVGGKEIYQTLASELYSSCGMCGQSPRFDVTPEGATVKGSCPDAEGITTVIRLEVPSGKIVVDDDLRPMFDGFNHDGFVTYNSARGQAQVVEAYADDKCAFGPVGNSCPGLWKTGEDTYVIANMPYGDEDSDEVAPIPAHAEKLAWVCTDLWAYSIVDFDEWTRRGGKLVEKIDEDTGESRMEPDNWTTSIVEIPPGVYEFTHHSGELGFDYDADHVVWADIRKVG